MVGWAMVGIELAGMDTRFTIPAGIFIIIINGVVTVFVAVLGRLLVVDFPDKVHGSRRGRAGGHGGL